MQKVIKNVRISAISTCVPEKQVDIYDNKLIFGGNTKKLNKVVKSTGFQKRHILEEGSKVTASDLCEKAAKSLFEHGISKDDICAVIMVTQYPDYFEPATACVLHGKLGLSDDCLAFDINQGCSGYIYGLIVASGLIGETCRKVLLLCGDTASKMVGPQLDVVDDMPIFGDGGCATILEHDKDADDMYFDIGASGKSFDVLISKNGGFRNPPTKDMFDEKNCFNYNNSMDGLKVFDFTMNTVPSSINNVMMNKNFRDSDVDYYVFHQANKMILENIAVSAGIDVDKVLVKTLSEYGNLSSASIASVICDEREIFNNKTLKAVLSGFGIGLAWGSVALTFKNPLVLPIIYY